MSLDPRHLLDVAVEAALEAGRITLEYFQTSGLDIELKENNSPVTAADKRSEERIIKIIRRKYPDHAVLGEESGLSEGTAGVTWIIDPLDGTKTFIAGVPFYGVMIGVEAGGEVLAGVVHFPALGETYHAARGYGSYWNGRRMRVSKVADLSQSLLLATDARRFEREPEKEPGFRRLLAGTKLFRTWGDCYGHMLVASGRAEIMLDPAMSVWDAAPLKVIVEEAGGIFTDWSGVPTIHSGSAISTNAAVRESAMELLR